MSEHPTSSMNWERTRSLFPVTREMAYFNNAGVAPISSRVDEAIRRYTEEATRLGAFHYPRFFNAEIERVRARAADLIHASADEVAFVKNTTEGIGIVASGLDWQRGDEVLTCDLEYPSNVYPWWSLRERGVETVMLHGREGRLPLAVVEEALKSPRVRLLALSSVEFGSGARNDLEALGALCREHGVLFCVDAIQSVGCFPIDVEKCGIDFLAADGHKWMLSVEGCGIFFCSKRVQDLITLRTIGWRSVQNNLDFDTYHMELQPGAGRFEEGSPNTPGIFALGAAIDLLLELDVSAIGERVLALTDRLVDGLRERGAELKSPREPGEASGIVSFAIPGQTPADTVRRLRAQRIFVIERRGGVRASPHFYNSEDEIDRLLAALG
ncbi:MAG: aminotransferase class V-fold PLP-dependent enzyme [Myxococcales bacterium]|nr:aminotransferase class V-fold PLP-dependent enzyme [Myxococcales bacterium]